MISKIKFNEKDRMQSEMVGLFQFQSVHGFETTTQGMYTIDEINKKDKKIKRVLEKH